MANIDQIDEILPQTQCGQCGYKACRPYAKALAEGRDTIDRCPPGGVETLLALGRLTGQDPAVYKEAVKAKTTPPQKAVIDEKTCIGCTKCIQACPVDAILGAAKQMHTVITDYCTGCNLCLEPCPVDCIRMETAPKMNKALKKQHAHAARLRYQRRALRLTKQKQAAFSAYEKNKRQGNSQLDTLQARQAVIAQSLARAQKKRKHALHHTSKQRCETIFQRFQSTMGKVSTELIYQTPFELLVAVILSARATDISVNKATKKLFAKANTPEQILALGQVGLESYIKNIGLYRNKATYILATAKQLLAYGGKIPHDRSALEALPGVGRKTANVLLNTLFDEPVIAVDTHVFRVSHRLGLASGKTPKQVEAALMKQIPTPYLKDAHHWLVLHGRYLCKSQKPICSKCFLHDLCTYPQKK